MNENILFGNKSDFAIELGFTKTFGKCKLCFWAQDKKMGSFTKGGELSFALKAYNIFKSQKEKFYLPEFEKMSPTEICKYLIDDLFVLGRSDKEDQQEEYRRRKKMIIFFGPQFTNDGCSMFLLYKEGIVSFIYSPPKKTIANSYETSFKTFCDVFDIFIEYCEKNKLFGPFSGKDLNV